MAYTPELSQRHSGTLRRIAWAVNKPMTKTMEQVFELVGKRLNSKKVCKACRDRSFCEDCPFNHHGKSKSST